MNDERVFNAAYEQLQPETAHVLFLDVVGYSKLASDLQPRVVNQLRMAVRNASEFKRARDDGTLICLPTGDGIALVFMGRDVAAPLRTAWEIASGLRAEANIGLRMGLHTGTVFRVPDINGTETVVGAGINFAQRVITSPTGESVCIDEPG
jgi:class 3 adenylate cyclase